jgi:hypothetical protein
VEGGFRPARGVGEGWVKVNYETATRKGTGLAAGCRSGASELTIRLGLKGAHTLHLALGSSTCLQAWLDGEGHREFVTLHGGNSLQECRLHASDLTGKNLHIALKDGYRAGPAFLGYVRAVPGESPHRNARNLIATNDGWSWVAVNGIQSPKDVSHYFTPFRDSDFFRMLWCPTGADFSGAHRTKVGTLAPMTSTHAFRQCDRDHAEALAKYIHSGGDLLASAVENAREIGMEIHFYIRVEAFQGPFPWEHTFTSKFCAAHPEWRCHDGTGDEILRMSYAYPQVQDHMLEYIEELLQYRPNGICLAFNRSLPMAICEEPVQKEFEHRQGRRPRLPEEADSPGMVEARTHFTSRFIERLHSLLGRKNLDLSCMVPANAESNRVLGLDLEDLNRREMFESVCVHSGGIHAAKSLCHQSPFWTKLRDMRKARVYPYGWGGSYDYAETARFLKECIFEPGFAGGFFWDTETNHENPYNWHVLRQGGTRDCLENIITGKALSPVIDPILRIQGVKLGPYSPAYSY